MNTNNHWERSHTIKKYQFITLFITISPIILAIIRNSHYATHTKYNLIIGATIITLLITLGLVAQAYTQTDHTIFISPLSQYRATQLVKKVLDQKGLPYKTTTRAKKRHLYLDDHHCYLTIHRAYIFKTGYLTHITIHNITPDEALLITQLQQKIITAHQPQGIPNL
ncbi:MAG TPA: hypothetical protein VLL52_21695 [Anaerolineae bacterium]|nr:hypothetical protein [Anaerolineae bacterium]